MSEHKQSWFSVLFGTRIRVRKDATPILNLSVLFMILAVLSAPWLVVAGAVIALALGYRFSIEKNAPDFSSDLQQVVEGAARNVREAVDSAVGEEP